MRSERRLDEAASYASDVGVLGVLQVLTRLRGLILLPVIARVLGTGAYGVWTQALVAVTLGSSVVDMQLHSALVRFVAGSGDRETQRGYFAPLLLVVAALGALAALLVALFPGPVATHVLGDPSYTGVAELLGVWIGLAAVGKLGLHMLRGLQRVKLYGLLDTLKTLLQLALVAAVVLVWRDLLLAVKTAIALEAAFGVLVLSAGFREVGLGWPGFDKLRPVLNYSLPLVPSFYAVTVLAFADRLIIASLLGAEAVGVYAAAYSLARVVREINRPISTALMPAVSRVWDRGDRDQGRWLLSNTLRYYVLLAAPALVGVVAVGERALGLLAPGAVIDGSLWLIAFVGVGSLLSGLQSVFAVLLHLEEDTRALAVSRLIAAPVYVLLVVVAVPRWGLLGGAVATTLGYGLDLFITSRLAWRRERFELPLRPAGKAALACAGMLAAVLLVLTLEGPVGLVLAVGAGLLSYTLLMLGQRAVGRRELHFLLRAVGSGAEDVPAQMS